MPLKLSDRGVATAYLSLPLGSFEAEQSAVTRAYEAWRDSRRKPREKRVVQPPTFLYLLGQADMAVQFRLTDFRRLFDISYPYSDSSGNTFNWLYSVPYERAVASASPPDRSMLRFLVHLRLRREIYAYSSAEEHIVRQLISVLGGHQDVEVHAALGWSDLVVTGALLPSAFNDFVHALVTIHGFGITAGPKRLDTFSRMFTIVGYDIARIPHLVHNGHVTLVRAIPGHAAEVTRALKQITGSLYLMEGKTDFAVLTDKTLPADFLERQTRFAENEKTGKWLQKLETHLMFTPESEMRRESVPSIHDFPVKKHVLHCACASDHEEQQTQIHKLLPLLPDELRQSVQNMLLLVRATILDDTLCCDVRTAVLALDYGVMTLLKRLQTVLSQQAQGAAPNDALAAPDFDRPRAARADRREAANKLQQEIYRVYRYLTEWHIYAERVLRQRSVGSFEEILGQSDRAITYYGGVQKFLFLADSLMNEFVRRIPNLPPDLPRFATLYDSVNTILSMPSVGTVQIPVRKIFQLPLVVADLWHEVGVALFSRRINYENLPTDKDLRPPQNRRTLYRELGDHYGDLIVYLFGYYGDWDRFMVSLFGGWIEVFEHEHEPIRPLALFEVVWRAYVVTEFDAVRRGQADSNHEKNVERIWTRVYDFLRTAKLARITPSLKMAPEEWQRIVEKAAGPDILPIRDFYSDLAVAVLPPQPRLRTLDFSTGFVRDLDNGDDLNDHFAEFAHKIRTTRPDAATAFRTMAALAKSATNEYHRRKMSVHDPTQGLRARVKVR